MNQNDKFPGEPIAMAVTPTQMQSLNIQDPQQVVDIAKQVSAYVRSQSLSTKIQGKDFVQVEGWQFAGSLFGLVSKVVHYENQSDFIEPITFTWMGWKNNQKVQMTHTARGVFKYFAEAHCVDSTGRVVAQGFAMCSNEEVGKHTFDEYAVFSMAQTRAVGKAYRMALSFIIKAAGYEPTPAEEMQDVKAAEEQAVEAVGLSDEIQGKINAFKTADELRAWANQQKDHHRNQIFLDEVARRIRDLEKPVK